MVWMADYISVKLRNEINKDSTAALRGGGGKKNI